MNFKKVVQRVGVPPPYHMHRRVWYFCTYIHSPQKKKKKKRGGKNTCTKSKSP